MVHVETPEIGSLTAHSPQESQFVGSSSGVFFINTVRQAFSCKTSGEFPPPEDTLVGSDSTPHDREGNPVSRWEYNPSVASVLGHAPPLDLARDLMMVYFKVWHPLFPFLHGPTFLHAMESLYCPEPAPSAPNQSDVSSNENQKKLNTAWTTILQCVFHLATLIRPDLPLPPECRIQPPITTSMHSLLAPLTARHDLLSIQALLASQLYLVATMSLHTASTVGGCIIRSMLHAGLHRCPFRYRELSASSQNRHLRKRIFWSAYALDRYLSQALGLPLGIQDSDIDVCPPGSPETHRPLHHLPLRPQPSSPSSTPARILSLENTAPQTEKEVEKGKEIEKRELSFASYVQSGKLTGEALELFHKSIYVRSISQNSILLLTTSVHKWWNSLDLPPSPPPPIPAGLDDVERKNRELETPFNFTPFFTILYQHLLILINRPALSLPPSTPEFASAMQSCISAARHILLALKNQRDANQALFWPGFLSAAWMAGLVLAFACQLEQYVLSKGCLEISSCLDFLHVMSDQWEPAKHCHRALSVLSRAISRRDPANANNFPNATSSLTQTMEESGARKRRKFNLRDQDPQALDSTLVSQGGPPNGEVIISSVPGSDDDENGNGEVQQDLSWDQSLDFDMDMVDLLQGANFDGLMDLFGQQYPTF